jgi:hypothetical protein
VRRAEDGGFIEGAQETAPEFPRVDVAFPEGILEGCSEGSTEEQGCDVFISVFSVSPNGQRDGRTSDSGSARLLIEGIAVRRNILSSTQRIRILKALFPRERRYDCTCQVSNTRVLIEISVIIPGGFCHSVCKYTPRQ